MFWGEKEPHLHSFSLRNLPITTQEQKGRNISEIVKPSLQKQTWKIHDAIFPLRKGHIESSEPGETIKTKEVESTLPNRTNCKAQQINMICKANYLLFAYICA